ncbi:MAG: hypothetical protein OXG35_27090, partial [Acidobacteria bacterium]|nr:hypothetical protein [Acidobacteriota bacterium]
MATTTVRNPIHWFSILVSRGGVGICGQGSLTGGRPIEPFQRLETLVDPVETLFDRVETLFDRVETLFDR